MLSPALYEKPIVMIVQAQGILHLRSPNLGPNSGKRILSRILVGDTEKGVQLKGYCVKTLSAHFCTILRKVMLFCRPFWQEQKRTETCINVQKRAKMHKNATFCTDACSTPVHYAPVSVHPI